MIPYLHNDLINLVKKILLLILKPDVVNCCNSIAALRNIDLNEKSNFLKPKDTNLGFGARKCINDLKKSDLVSNKEVTSYLSECITFVTIIVSRLFEKSPLGSVVVRNADAFDPNVIANLEVHELQKRVKQILIHLLKLKILTASQSDKALDQSSLFYEQVKKMHLDELKLFNTAKTNLDDFFFHELGSETKKYDVFSYILKIILTLSHGQAVVERGYSLGKSSLQTNITEESIIAKKVIQDHLQSNKINISTYNVPNKLIFSCNSACSKYKASLKGKAKETERDKQKEKTELLQKEIDELVDKEKKLNSTCDSLDDEFVKLVADAEKKPEEMTVLITKAIALKRRRNEIKENVKEVQKVIEEKRAKLH